MRVVKYLHGSSKVETKIGRVGVVKPTQKGTVSLVDACWWRGLPAPSVISIPKERYIYDGAAAPHLYIINFKNCEVIHFIITRSIHLPNTCSNVRISRCIGQFSTLFAVHHNRDSTVIIAVRFVNSQELKIYQIEVENEIDGYVSLF